MRHPKHHGGKVVATADGVKDALYVRGVPMFSLPSLGAMGIGVFEDHEGAIEMAENLLARPTVGTLAHGIICSGSWLPVVLSPQCIFNLKISTQVLSRKLLVERG